MREPKIAHAPGLKEAVLIKLDIINEVVNRTGITKTKAEMAVETVFESMKKALEQGDRIELRGFGVFNVKPRKDRDRAQSAHRRGSFHSARQGRAFQARQGVTDAAVGLLRAAVYCVTPGSSRLRLTLTPPKAERAEHHAYVLRSRTRERYWLYALLFALTLVTTTHGGRPAMQMDFDRNLPFDIEHSLELYSLLLAASCRSCCKGCRFR